MTDALDMTQLAAAVNQHFVCFDLTFSWQRAAGQRQIKKAVVKLGDNELDTEKATKPTSKLMPSKWRDRFQEIETAKSKLIRAHTLTGMAGGTACVRSGQASAFLQKLLELRGRVHTLREELRVAWQVDIIDWNAERWGADWDAMAKHLPKPESLVHIIDLTWSQFQIMPMTGLEHAEGVMDSMEYDELATITRKMTEERVQSFVTAVFEEPRQRLVKAVQAVSERLKSGQKITSNTFNQMRDAAAFLREMTDMPGLSDTSLLAQLAETEKMIEEAPHEHGTRGNELQSIDIAKISEGLNNSLDAIIERADDAGVVQDQLQRFGRLGRGLDLDD